MFIQSIQNDRGTAWDRQYQPLGVSLLPPAVDLRYTLNNAGIEIYTQGNLNSCTANALCTAWRYAQALVDPGFTPSRLFLYYNERLAEGTASQNSGAFVSDGCRSLVTFGVCSEFTWPYDERIETIQPPPNAYSEAQGHVIHTPSQISNYNMDNLKYSLIENKPFVVGIALYSEFESDYTRSTGIVPMPGSYSQIVGLHAVICVGYDDQRGFWIFRNSWGPQWGDQGHFYLPYEYLSIQDNLASDFWNLTTDYQET